MYVVYIPPHGGRRKNRSWYLLALLLSGSPAIRVIALLDRDLLAEQDKGHGINQWQFSLKKKISTRNLLITHNIFFHILNNVPFKFRDKESTRPNNTVPTVEIPKRIPYVQNEFCTYGLSTSRKILHKAH